MKIGTENKKTTMAAVALLVLAALLLFRAVPRPQAHKSSPEPAARPYLDAVLTSSTKADSHHYIAFLLKPTLDPHLRLDLLAQSEGIKYGGAGRDIFTEHPEEIPEEIPKPNAPGLLTSVKPDWQPPTPAPPPPINLKFWGWITRPGESKAAFLAQGEHGFVAHEGDIVARRYKLVKISQASIEVEDVLNNNRLTIAVDF
jgi:hypothetical protein